MREDNRFGWAGFLGRTPGTAGLATYAVPASIWNIATLAPPWIGMGSTDIFASEENGPCAAPE